MKRFALLLGAAAVLLLSGCLLFNPVRGSGTMVTTPYNDIGTFTRIAASNACQISVVPDATTSLSVTCDENLVSYLDVRKTGVDSVTIGLKPGYWYLGYTFTAVVHLPALAALDLSGASGAEVPVGFSSTNPLSLVLSGASHATFDSIVTGTLTANVSGSSHATFRSLGSGNLTAVLSGASVATFAASCGALTADVSGASDLTVSGTSSGEHLVVSGASYARMLDLVAPDASANLSGGSQAWVDVGAGYISLMASGASTLNYRGSPNFDIVDLSGGSRVQKVY